MVNSGRAGPEGSRDEDGMGWDGAGQAKGEVGQVGGGDARGGQGSGETHVERMAGLDMGWRRDGIGERRRG